MADSSPTQTTTIFADLGLARRLEDLVAQSLSSFARTSALLAPDSGAEYIQVAGGVAAFIAPGSPVNGCVGLGLHQAVAHDDIEHVESFFATHGSGARINVCPLADESLIRVLGERGWVAEGFENVLAMRLSSADHQAGPPPAGAFEIREALTAQERADWALVAANGFSWPLPPLAEQLHIGNVVAHRPESRLFLAWEGACAAGTGELSIADGVGWLSADSTLPGFRRRGIQRALQSHRLCVARAAGCDLAVTESHPGSDSQRNMERLGFRVVYTRVDFVAPAPVHDGTDPLV